MLHIVQTGLATLLSFLFVLGLVVTIHELGHFLAGKACGAAIDRFSIGFGRALVSWRDRSGVEWRIAWIPLGGYVKFSGDDNAAGIPTSDDLAELKRAIMMRHGAAAVRRYLVFKPLWQRAVVAAAGPFANFVLAIALFAIFFSAVGDRVWLARVGAIQPGLPAAQAGFQPGDLILRADNESIDGFESLSRYVQIRAGAPIRFKVQRAGRAVDLVATPVLHEEPTGLGDKQKIGVLGIIRSERPDDVRYMRYNPIQAVGAGATQTWSILKTSVYLIGSLAQGRLPTSSLSGPIGIAQISGAAIRAGVVGAPSLLSAVQGAAANLLALAAVVSVSVGFMNLLPVPVLDGGALLFYAYEAVARRPLGAGVQATGYRVGLALLLGLMLFATWNDLTRLRVFQFLGGLFS